MTTAIDLTKSALLTRLTISQFSPRKKCPTVQMEAAEKHGADLEHIESQARQIAKERLKEITGAVSAARGVFYLYTLPFDDSGYRLCPMKVYGKMTSELRKQEMVFLDAVETLASQRDMLEAEAREKLKDLFDEIGFPNESELREAYKFRLDEMPLSNPKDVRLNHVSDEQVEAIQKGLQARIDAKLQAAQGEIIERMIALIGNVAEQCSKDNPRIYDTLIGNIEQAVEVLPSLNISDDPEIARLIERARIELSEISPEALRRDGGERVKAAEKADSLLNELKNFKFKV